MKDLRLEQAKIWLSSLKDLADYSIKPLAGDASFRRYFRVIETSPPYQSYVLMDAPPKKEDLNPFLNVCQWFARSGLNAPKIINKTQSVGFLLLEDFGDVTWSKYYNNSHNISFLFEDALQQLHQLQAAPTLLDLPSFDVSRMQTEVNLYLDWYLPYVEQYNPSSQEKTNFHSALLTSFITLDQLPKVPVHLDYHSRNLMLPKQGVPLGIIDFQDAVFGPITYDLASLLYDCYQDYPENIRQQWSKHFFLKLSDQHQAYFNHQFETWHHTLRLTALQRHIKAIGIFSRLAHRDGKRQFLDEIPLTRKHLADELSFLSLDIPLLNI